MFKNYFLVAWRSLVRNKTFSGINILGLALGLACSILILLWVTSELSYDNFHQNGSRIYRVTASLQGSTYPLAGAPLAADLKAQIPGIKNAARIKGNYGEPVVFSVGNRNFETSNAYYADPDILQIFSFPLVSGNQTTALQGPNQLLLTQQTARKFFGTEDVVGKTLRMRDSLIFTVSGVLKDIPANSHLQFDILLPMSFDARTDEDILYHHYDGLNFHTYLQLEDKADASPAALAALGRKITAINKKGDPTFSADFALQPLARVHLYSKFLSYDLKGQGDIAYVRIFSIIAAFVLIVACINFMNLATARSARRAREVGVRKVLGAWRSQLIGQFIGESLLITFLALLLGIILVIISLPAFNQVLGATLVFPLTNGWFIACLMLVFLLTSLISGSYPAFFLSSFRPVKVLKSGTSKAGSGSLFFRNGLVVFQFVISVVLIIGTTVVYNQMHFIRNRDLGYDKENQLYIPLKGNLSGNIDALTAILRDNPRLSHYSVVSELPVNVGMGTSGVQWQGQPANVQPMFSVMGVDEHFVGLFHMELAAGRGFSASFLADTLNYVVNERALKTLGWDLASAIGKPLMVWGNRGVVVGVVKDFNYKPAQSAIDPLILRYNPGAGKEWLRRYIVISIPAAVVAQSITSLRSICNKLNPSYTFEYGFVDQQLERSYLSQQRMGMLFNIFSLLAIFISCLGLTGLAAFIAERRTKEIGIRKVLGANVAGLVSLLSVDFLKLVLIAVLIASPIAWYFMHRWLLDFAYRISLSVWIFVLAGGLALLIAFLTVSFQAIKAARTNPVVTLHAE
jgi:putative ABC transport system permease protein